MLVMIMMMTIMLIPVQEFRLLTEVSTCNSAVLFSLGLASGVHLLVQSMNF